MHNQERRAIIAGAGILLATATGAVATPSRKLADELPPLSLEDDIPRAFGTWSIDQTIQPVLPAPDVQERLDKLYNKILSRTYRNEANDKVMFLIAYGSDQADRTTLAHLPESCYSSQGFDILSSQQAAIPMGSKVLDAIRVRTRRGPRIEPVTYWTTVGDSSFNEESARRWARARYALKGIIPDGMLVRASSVGADEAAGFSTHVDFLQELFSNVTPAVRERLYGKNVV